jgi:hypothetical protein
LKNKKNNGNGRSRLEDALTTLAQSQATFVQNQATLVQTQAAFVARLAESERVNSERFARIEADIAMILRVLGEHSRMIQALPDAVRDKIGLKT